MFGVLEGTGVTVHDPRFHRVIPGSARVERLWTGARWSEGPAWFPAHNTLVWSDIPNDRMLRYDALTGQVGTFRQPARNANGNTVDAQGRLVTCEHGGRQVTRTEHDGSVTVLASHFGGKRLNSPNDVVVKSDGSIWFTDPDYGILSDYEGDKSPSEIGACNVYRIDGQSGEIAIVADAAMTDGGAIVQDAVGGQVWDNRLLARLARLWPELRRQIAVRAGLVVERAPTGGSR